MHLLDHLNISPKHVIAFGDFNNDIELLKTANTGYAMQDATEELKNVADAVIGSNNDNSVLNKIIELLDL